MADEELWTACLEPKSVGLDEKTVYLLPAVLTGVFVLIFLRWQFASAGQRPLQRWVPQLDSAASAEAPAQIKCLVYNWLPKNFGCCSASGFALSPFARDIIGLIPIPFFFIPFQPKPLEYISSWTAFNFIFTWPYQPRYDEPIMTVAGRETVALVCLAMQLVFFMGLGSAANLLIEEWTDSGTSTESNLNCGKLAETVGLDMIVCDWLTHV